ncbi:hypothetical protein GCM10012275_42980 [Longimycelium tulufanense]|uniref:Uncharacterized protein n=1 Tax=Longimycelium tulufanense TaxID=907463 RepID=A0A8J3FWN0_9PSEU|nr:hypothetical protein [Longimycelium tulufanense]GGM67776.1 hypothetical protein GCM10012275_42980 [Longimycelium tulufanense]
MLGRLVRWIAGVGTGLRPGPWIDGLTTEEIAHRAGIPPRVARRRLEDLRRVGWVVYCGRRWYQHHGTPPVHSW